jgi:hypothetical protein
LTGDAAAGAVDELIKKTMGSGEPERIYNK